MAGQLALTLPLAPRETAFSFMARLAARNGVTAAEFGRDMGIVFPNVIDGKPEALGRLAEISGATPADLAAWSPKSQGNWKHTFRGETFNTRGVRETTLRGCPTCLREDAENSHLPPEQAMAVRGTWLPRHVTLCLHHQHPLVPLWNEKTPARRYDTPARFAEIADKVLSGDLDRPIRDAAPFDLWFERRLVEGPADGWLDQFALFPAAHFCELLGRAIFAVEIPKWRKMPSDRIWCCYDLGYKFASQGEMAIRRALGELQQYIGAPMDGPKKKFGDLYDRLAHDLTDEDYRPFRDLLRDHIATTWPLGPGDELMGEPIQERRVHSVLTAARDTGIDPRRLRKLLAEADLIQPAGEGRPDAWELFDAVAAAPFLRSLGAGVSAMELQEKLCISRSQFDLLRQDGYFPPILGGDGHKPMWDIQAGRAFFDSLLAGAEPIYVPMHDWCDLATAAQRLKIRPGEIVAMIEARQLMRVGKHLGRDGYAAILVDLAEVERLLVPSDAKGLTIELFAKTVGLRPTAAMRLVRAGHIPSTESTNPKTKAIQRFLTPADIDAFHARFVTLRRLAAIIGRSWQTLRVLLVEAGIEVFTSDGADVGAVYEWDVIEAAFWCRWPRIAIAETDPQVRNDP